MGPEGVIFTNQCLPTSCEDVDGGPRVHMGYRHKQVIANDDLFSLTHQGFDKTTNDESIVQEHMEHTQR